MSRRSVERAGIGSLLGTVTKASSSKGCSKRSLSSALSRAHPSVPQLIWHQEVLPFIYHRFDECKLEKQMHHQWDEDARRLFAAAGQVANADEFVASVEVVDKL